MKLDDLDSYNLVKFNFIQYGQDYHLYGMQQHSYLNMYITYVAWYFHLGTIAILRQQSDWGGLGQKMTIFADVQYYLCWRKVDGWVRKSSRMVPWHKLKSVITPIPKIWCKEHIILRT